MLAPGSLMGMVHLLLYLDGIKGCDIDNNEYINNKEDQMILVIDAGKRSHLLHPGL